MAVVFKNNAKTTLASSLTSSATSVTVADGSAFPSLSGGDTFFCTFDDGTNVEVVKVTARSSNTLTIVRAQDDTTARAFSTGDVAELRLTAGILNLFSQTGVAITDEIEAYLDANGLTFPDNVKAQFGASNDLQIYHNGSSSHIDHTTTVGDLVIRNTATDRHIFLQTDNGSGGEATYLKADGGNGTLQLFHYGSLKASTTSSGFSVTGEVNLTGELEINGTDVIDSSRNLVNINEISLASELNFTGNGDKIIDVSTKANSNNFRIRHFNPADNSFQTALELVANGAGVLTHSGNNKLATTSTGIDVTGRIDLDDSNTQLSSGSGNSLRVQTDSGQLELGAQNTSYAHISTDRPQYYFNKFITVDGGIFNSYNEDAILRRAGSSSNQITIGSTAISATLPFHTTGEGDSIGHAFSAEYYYDESVGDSDGADTKWTLKDANGTDVTSTTANKVYRVRLVTLGTGTDTGSVWLADNVDGAGWRVKAVSVNASATESSNYPKLEIDSSVPKVSLEHTSAYNVRIFIEEYNTGNSGGMYTIFGSDAILTYANNGHKLGINKENPAQRLDVNGTVGINGTEIITTARNLTNIGTISSGKIGVGANTASYWSQANSLVLDDSGNTGLTIKSGTSGNGRVVFTDTTSTTAGFNDGGQIHYGHTNDEMKIRTAGTDALTISSSQNATFAGTISSGTITSSGTLRTTGGSIQVDNGDFIANRTGNDFSFVQSSSANSSSRGFVFQLAGGGNIAGQFRVNSALPLRSANGYAVDSTTVIDSSRNLTNIGTGNFAGNVTVSAGSSYPLQVNSTQRYQLQIRNPNNTTNSSYGWWLAHDTNFNFALHADGAADRFTLTRAGNATFAGSISGTLASTVTATTQAASDNSTKVSTTAYVTTAIANLVDGAPSTLNTLNEIAAALNDDAALNTTLTNSIAAKLPLAGGTMTGDLNMGSQNITNAGTIASDTIEINTNANSNTHGLNITNSALSGAGSLKIAIPSSNGSYSSGATLNDIIMRNETSGGSIIIAAPDSVQIGVGGSDNQTRFTIDSSGDATFTGTISSGAITSSGDILGAGVYVGSANTSFDFYNNGTSYLNGATTVDDALNLTGSNGALKIAGTTVINSSRDLTNIASLNMNTGSAVAVPKTFNIANTASGSGRYIKFGTLSSTAQDGRSLKITVHSNAGYNASDAQNQETIIRFKTSNNSSNQSGFYGDCQKYDFGNRTGSPAVVLVKQVSSTEYEFYGQFDNFTGESSFYTVEHRHGTWTHDGTDTGTTAPTGTVLTATERVIFTSGTTNQGLQLDAGSLAVGSTEIVTSARNLTNIGTIGSGAITSTGVITGSQDFKATGNNMKLHAGGNHIINIDLNGNFYPQTHNAVDLGFSDSLAFRNLHLVGAITGGATISSGHHSITTTGTGNGLYVSGGDSSGQIKVGSYTRITGATASNTGAFSFNANYTGGQTNEWTPDYSGSTSAGMFVLRQDSGGIGSTSVYVKNSGTTSSAQALSTFTKVAQFHQDGYFSTPAGLRVGSTEVISSSRNLTNIGTISSGAISSEASTHYLGGIKIAAENASQNYIAFSGTTGDAPGTYSHSYIGERIHSSSERSELVLAKYNDIEGASGSDRIRMIGNNIVFDTYSSVITPSTGASLSTAVGTGSPTTKMTIDEDGDIILSNSAKLKGAVFYEVLNAGNTDGTATSPRFYSHASGKGSLSAGGAARLQFDSGSVTVGSTNGRLNLTSATYSFGTSFWAGTSGYPGYQFTGGNSRFGFSSTTGVLDVYADGNFYATDSAYRVWHANDFSSTNISNWNTAYSNASQALGTSSSPTFNGLTTNSDITFSDSGTTKRGIRGTMGANDMWFIGGGATASNAGYMEIATGDDGQTAGGVENMYFSSYGPGSPWSGTLLRRHAMFDSNGQTIWNHQRTPTSVIGILADSSIVINTRSGSHNYIQFRNDSDDGTHAGLVFTDNNHGGSILFTNHSATENTAGRADTLHLSGYQGVDIRSGTGAAQVPANKTRLARFATAAINLDKNTSVTGTLSCSGNLTVSSSNATGGGIILADDGDIVDLNDAYCSMRFSSGVRVFSANRGGSAVIALKNDGQIIANSNITAYGSASDIRLKENIETIEDPINKVKKLRGVTFDYKKDGSRSTGLIAQELEEVLPEVVYETTDAYDDNNKYKAVRYGNVVGLLVEAIKDQQKEIEYMKSEIKTLKENNNGN